jgi:uncharacterized membrane protein
MTIRSPIEWTGSQILHAAHAAQSVGRALYHVQETLHSPAPAVQKITLADLREALVRGCADFAAYRSDVFFLVVFYPILNLLLVRVAFGTNLLPLLFPLASGLAMISSLAAVGLYEMSRRREDGLRATWRNGIEVIHRPAFGAIAVLGALLAAIFVLWLAVAWLIFENTMGPALPTSITAFIRDIVTTDEGHRMSILGIGVGFLFALLTMTLSIVSFPLLVDRDVGLDTAIKTSFRAVVANPLPMAVWGMIVVAALILGSIPFFLGLVVALPVLGHSTWHLYRKMVVR